MPELPEVEVSRLGIAPHIEGQTITQVNVHQPQLRWPVSEQVYALAGNVITQVSRRAKYLLLHCDEGAVILHLGMSGHLRVVDSNTALKKHDHIEFQFANGLSLRLNDSRRFGACLWQPLDSVHSVFQKLGPEPLTTDFDAQWLFARSRNKKQPIKQFIMDNQVVVGVGNIYANESLFKAGIHPKREAGKVSLTRYQKLTPLIKATLAAAIEQGGTTLKDFSQSDGKPGYFAQQLLVYGRKGEPCTSCATTLTEIRLGGRSTVYCKKCQR
ncbi:bifunctional DNA-formamidopyrimidine glycosylase/DNA-(apurinic or apyrimidinic site) lyase [Pseudoalteromonas ruthenica]|uniref:Formamidopyrimidine-DNA glycosylase n=1 Tax=Pseudoalteromonas ruthenica TaxID=151081 RepID=A0A0F4Q5M9_9GAMM|nr:bifunctional DNA-formamidopyrimidine glycosylase/DNA-(apurinic or apyrimidinic site) lyase [Pseudoalteromonas ruthenica]KJY97840.1 formamidopyrimidine-DNA glycosylase [Pseudoalteromonas ruthenica]KJZ01867.1 formamidopyrimidine-DNA glycosylase [Pseudoalteromonas ruthenica]TMO89234.1 bifunctional DNA-formamidopyrimidine glycosylase/DNA-(apurinic or apyrimidinic site) lyase [Pseudoalteromonas ruthenica]TMO94732.1 bifunctional DNA-formamidopyrimidine glycosylase/DNA-(apurinic or apyrimidinic sit